MHFAFTLETLDRRFQRLFLQSTLTVPKMFVAAAEETQENLIQGRGDAYCGMLNASYNLALRNIGAYIPEYPVGDADDCADMIHEFLPIARAIYGLNNLKIISFGPRPLNFLACKCANQAALQRGC